VMPVASIREYAMRSIVHDGVVLPPCGNNRGRPLVCSIACAAVCRLCPGELFMAEPERDCLNLPARFSKSARPQLGDWGRWGGLLVYRGNGTPPSKLKK
jgi:hypothetical protein